jgi:hypothetical protein
MSVDGSGVHHRTDRSGAVLSIHRPQTSLNRALAQA